MKASEELVERIAEAAREAYAAFRGDKETVPFKHAPSRLAWICCAKAMLRVMEKETRS